MSWRLQRLPGLTRVLGGEDRPLFSKGPTTAALSSKDGTHYSCFCAGATNPESVPARPSIVSLHQVCLGILFVSRIVRINCAHKPSMQVVNKIEVTDNVRRWLGHQLPAIAGIHRRQQRSSGSSGPTLVFIKKKNGV